MFLHLLLIDFIFLSRGRPQTASLRPRPPSGSSKIPPIRWPLTRLPVQALRQTWTVPLLQSRLSPEDLMVTWAVVRRSWPRSWRAWSYRTRCQVRLTWSTIRAWHWTRPACWRHPTPRRVWSWPSWRRICGRAPASRKVTEQSQSTDNLLYFTSIKLSSSWDKTNNKSRYKHRCWCHIEYFVRSINAFYIKRFKIWIQNKYLCGEE